MSEETARKRTSSGLYRKPPAATEVPQDLPVLSTFKDWAPVVDLSERELGNLARRGEIPAIRLGRSWRINTKAFLEQLGIGA